ACLLCALALLLAAPGFAATIYVDASVAPGGTGNGSSWANAHQSLQTALTAAQSGDQIWVAQGTYKPTTSTTDREASFVMKEGVKIYGGFTSGQMNLIDRNPDPETNGTILSGDIDGDGTLNGNSFLIIFNNQIRLSSAAVLDGFTITGARGNTNGGAMLNSGGSTGNACSPYIANCLFRDNYAINNGAAVFNGGAGIECNPQFVNCTFRNNTTGVAGLFGQGSAVYNNAGFGRTTNPQFTNCTFQNNSAGFRGGAVYIEVGSGGGESVPIFTNCSFQNNSFGSSGGGGGAVYIQADAIDGKSVPIFTNCSFQGNGGSSSNGGALNRTGPGVLAILNNCVFWDNGRSNAFSISRGASYAVANHSLFDATMNRYSGSNNLTTTVNPFISSTSTQLRPGSPAINAGLTSANTTQTDLAGNPRVAGSGIDMGAYEFPCTPFDLAVSGNTLVSLGYDNCTTLTASASGGTASYAYVWKLGNAVIGQNASQQLCPETTTTYTVTATDAIGCVSEPKEVTVTVQDVRCGNKNQNVTICYYGVTQCVSEKIAERYLKLGATLGGCGTGNARIGAEETTDAPFTLSLKAFPNPVQDAMTLEVMAPNAGAATFEVLDLTGRPRQSRTENLVEGLNQVEFRLGTLPTGMYFIKAVDALGRKGAIKVSKE
ncbi:choice-of-anchor Q domain-containing protein, partial [Persicitalea sp.]|uniref:choice-of-anchor Q domain-containing protein n=1 Tax=Persicitalea sp. TaxID=3100273 RepID=UPI00359339E4